MADPFWRGRYPEVPVTLRGNGCSAIPLGVDYGFSTLRQMQQAVLIGSGLTIG